MRISLLLLFVLTIPSLAFGESIKVKFDRSWHPKIKGLNHCMVKLVSSKPMIGGLRKPDGSVDYYETVLHFTEFAELYPNILKPENQLTKKSLQSLEMILADYIGLKSVDLEQRSRFTLEMLSLSVEKLFIKSGYAVTAKVFDEKDERDHQTTRIEYFFHKN